ncbi:MAG TPA: hypothetical protein DCS93_32015 [Microscillaceae bacterium]|nr:hypothetical protein [Microscillaceae bacterium]
MTHTFADVFEKYCTLSPAVKSKINALATTLQGSKNDILLNQGQVCRHIFLITQGAARMFYYHDGKEVTNEFFFDQDVVADMQSLYAKKQSLFNIQLLEDCQLLSIKYSDLEQLYAEYHPIETAGRLIAIECFLEESERNRSFQMYTAKERYGQLIDRYPQILNRVSLGHIASYIGVSQIQLSRIRAQLVP